MKKSPTFADPVNPKATISVAVNWTTPLEPLSIPVFVLVKFEESVTKDNVKESFKSTSFTPMILNISNSVIILYVFS